MKNENQKIAFRMLILISAPRLTKKALKLFDQGRIPFQYQCRALGTASSEIMDMLGLGSVDKDLLLSVMPKPFADIMLKKIKETAAAGHDGQRRCVFHSPDGRKRRAAAYVGKFSGKSGNTGSGKE